MPDQSHVDRYTLADLHAGKDLRTGVKVNWKSAAFTTWDEAVAELAGGIVVTARCNAPDIERGGRWPMHRMRFNPDGSIDLLGHPGREVDSDAEQMLAGLGGQMGVCVMAATYFPRSQQAPLAVMRAVGVNSTIGLRSLWTAVQWAQRPDTDWSPEFGDTHLRFGITPQVQQRWVDAGWDPHVAARFWQQFVPIELAERWRAAGKVRVRDAKVAGRGESPEQESAWAAAGLSPTESARWRRTGIGPAEAAQWVAAGFAPAHREGIVARQHQYGIPPEVALEWGHAGLPGGHVVGWWHATNGDLGTALEWHRHGVDPGVYSNYRSGGGPGAFPSLTPQIIGEYAAAGFPLTSMSTLESAVAEGVQPGAYLQTLENLRRGWESELQAKILSTIVTRQRNANRNRNRNRV